jgi:hypothetical protein
MSLRRRATSWILVLCLGVLGLSCGLTELLWPTPTHPLTIISADTSTVTATETAPVPSDTPIPTPTETPSPDSPPTQTATPTLETPTDPAATDTPEPLPTDTLTPTPTETPEGLRIDSFDVEMEDAAGGGKTIRCTWETSGASGVRILLGTRHRFPIWQDDEPDGTATFEVTDTLYNNPEVMLTAFGSGGGDATESVTLDWPCSHTYFFAAVIESPRICPTAAALNAQGAQQPFQGGAMMWIPGIEGKDWIYILYNDGAWQSFEDTWHEGLPESDPSIIPPTGYEQPIRGFGKVWREHAEVQNKLNWATTGESAVLITYQRQVQESIGGVHFIQAGGAKLMRLDGIGGSGSTWISLP